VTEDQAWAQVMSVAKQYNLITSAYGGVAVLCHPDVQREQGIRLKTLHANGMTYAEAEKYEATLGGTTREGEV